MCAKIRTPIDTTRNIANDRKCNHQFSKQSAPSCKECTSTIVTEQFPKIGRAIGRNLLPFLMAKKTSFRPDSRIRKGLGEVLITIFLQLLAFRNFLNYNSRLLKSHMRLKINRPYNHWLKSQGHYLLCFSTSSGRNQFGSLAT